MKASRRTKIKTSRELRKNQTDAERILWNILRNRLLDGIKFRRQYCIDKYILDFYSPEFKLAIEADGGQHYEDSGMKQDRVRSKELLRLGIKILRFNNLDILDNSEGVREEIQKTLTSILSLKKGEEV